LGRGTADAVLPATESPSTDTTICTPADRVGTNPPLQHCRLLSLEFNIDRVTSHFWHS